MSHGGPRVGQRGGRHNNSRVKLAGTSKQSSASFDSASNDEEHIEIMGEPSILSVSAEYGNQDHDEEEEHQENGGILGYSNEFLERSLETLTADEMRAEVEVLQSRVRELETSLEEKCQQLNFRENQVATLRKKCNLLQGVANRKSDNSSSGHDSLLKSMLQRGSVAISRSTSNGVRNGF